MRKAVTKRKTKETDIFLELNIDGKGQYEIETEIGFFNHMLELFSKHSLMDMKLVAKGDVFVDCHHTVEDTAIVIGETIKKALGDKSRITRYADILLPMDETLTSVAVDLGGRPYTVFNCPVKQGRIGEMDFQTIEEFIVALSNNLGANIHVNVLYGSNLHHIAESIFKALARSLRQAVKIDENETGIPSTKGEI
ncbi:MAG TPA: imidazoleglycerol-phosphate dehydratase HisB [Clostridia bacterium]|nr:imidazoleglycerol-phosphate dehydratase HisB [Clostridia bacterium]